MSKRAVMVWMAGLMAIAAVLRAIVADDARVFFDGCGYIMHAWSIGQGKLTTPYWASGIDHYYPPLYPFFIYIFHVFTGSWTVSAKAVSLVFGVLLIIPAYLLGRKMFSEDSGIFAAALLVAFPIFVQLSGNAFSEPLFVFLTALAMLMGWRLILEKKARLAFLAGVFLGLAYLARTQAMVGLVSLMLCILWSRLATKQLKSGQVLKFAVAGLIGFYLFALPYDYYCYQHDKIWGLRARQEFFKKWGVQHTTTINWSLNERTLNKDAGELFYFELAKQHSQFEYILRHPGEYKTWVVSDLKYIVKDEFLNQKICTALAALSILFLVHGLIFHKNKLTAPGPHVYLFLWFFPPFIFFALFATIFDRYFLNSALILALWAGCGLAVLRSTLARTQGRELISYMVSPKGLWLWVLPLLFFNQPLKTLNLAVNKEVFTEAELDRFYQLSSGAKEKIIMSPEPYLAAYTGNYWYLLPAENINRAGIYAQKQGADFIWLKSGGRDSMFDWLHAPADYYDQFFSGFDKPGLKFLGRLAFLPETARISGKDEPVLERVLYRVKKNENRARAKDRPNIILVSIDSLRPDHLSCYGYHKKTSPNLDRIAGLGVRFEKTIAQSPETAASNMTVLTSTYPEVHGIQRDKGRKSYDQLPAQVKTVPQILGDNGYQTAAFVSGFGLRKGFGFERGFDLFEENMAALGPEGLDRALDWVAKRAPEQKFFLLLNTAQMRFPYCPPPTHEQAYDRDYKGLFANACDQDASAFENLGPTRVGAADVEHLKSNYDRDLEYADEMLGRFISGLEEQGLFKDGKTLLIIYAGHGEGFGEHGGFLHKNLYRETVGTPLIFYGPGVVPEALLVRGQVRLLDLAPTILELAGLDPEPQMQGVSLAGLFKAESQAFLAAYSEFGYDQAVSLRRQSYMYYQAPMENHFYLTLLDQEEQKDLLGLLAQPGFATNDFIFKSGRSISGKAGDQVVRYHFFNRRFIDNLGIKNRD